jgi:hypothetical protein
MATSLTVGVRPARELRNEQRLRYALRLDRGAAMAAHGVSRHTLFSVQLRSTSSCGQRSQPMALTPSG